MFSSRKPQIISSAVRTLSSRRLSPKDMAKIDHDQVFLLEYAPINGSQMNGKRMLIKLHKDSHSPRFFSVIFISNTDKNDWSTTDNDYYTGIINNLYNSFNDGYSNMETDDVKMLEDPTSRFKYNITFMPIETIMGRKFKPAEKKKYIKVLNELVEQHGRETKLPTEIWDHIMTYLVGDNNSKIPIRGGKKTRKHIRRRSRKN